MKTIYFITSNNGKLEEAKKKFVDLDINIIQKDLGYPEIQADSLEEVAMFGANYIKNRFDKPFMLEDAGLFIDVLKGFPGVFSAYVYHSIGLSGVLELLKDKVDRKATFRSVYAYVEPNKKPLLFIGQCNGVISEEKLGDQGFGYDPIFIPQGSSRTFAQMQTNEKNKISHRGDSLNKFIDYFKNI
jgi:XTP/dITP diphosphohydrolase